METRHVELDHFARRALDYRAALQHAPDARFLEINVVVAIACGIYRERGWDKENVPIIDLMAGSGVLSNALVDAGFGRVVAIEMCPEMRSFIDNRRIKVHALVDLGDIPLALRDYQPGLIVSIAGFHHLIEYDGQKINRARSVLCQAELIDLCLTEMRADGGMLVVDLMEPSAGEGIGLKPIEAWDAANVKNTVNVPERFRVSLTGAHSVTQYNEGMAGLDAVNMANPAISWFRQVVNHDTALGHNDVALSNELLRVLKMKYTVSFSPFLCPWIFRDTEQMKFFVSHKFGFLVNKKEKYVNLDRVLGKAKEHTGITALSDGKLAFGWNLAAMLVTKRDRIGAEHAKKETVDTSLKTSVILSLIALLLGVRILARLMLGPGAEGILKVIDGLALVLAGMIIQVVLAWVVTPQPDVD